MKKLSAIVIASFLGCVSLFAEFVIGPSLGYSNVISGAKFELKAPGGDKFDGGLSYTLHSMTIGLDAGYLMESGLSFYFNNNVSFLTSAKFIDKLGSREEKGNFSKTKGALWDSELLAGWTFRDLAPNLRIALLAGLGLGYGSYTPTQMKDDNGTHDISERDQQHISFSHFNVGLALHFNVQYFFTDIVGIGLSLTDSIGYGKACPKEATDDVKGTFANLFNVKLGPTFKF